MIQGIKRFIYASSSSVYGIKKEKNVTEGLPLEPLTDYSKYKALCEEIVLRERTNDFVCLILRPATVCGYSPRQRMDLTVNILTNYAVHNNRIRVFGGKQLRPNIHIQDVANLYVKCLEYPSEIINGEVFNAGYENYSIMEIAEMVRSEIGENVDIAVEQTDDLRSYHISSEKIRKELGFEPEFTISNAVNDVKEAIANGNLQDSMNNPLYFNIKRMKEINLT